MTLKINTQKAQKIKMIVTDIDGVLTHGSVFIRDDFEEPFGKFNILDGFAVSLAKSVGLNLVVLSGRKSLATEARCQKLGFDIIHTGVHDKLAKLMEIIVPLEVSLDEIAYIGDDLIDLGILTRVGLSCAPANAVDDVKKRVDYITQTSGGDGVYREVVEFIARAQGTYSAVLEKYLK